MGSYSSNSVLGIWGTTRGLARCAETANEKQCEIRSCSVGGPRRAMNDSYSVVFRSS